MLLQKNYICKATFLGMLPQQCKYFAFTELKLLSEGRRTKLHKKLPLLIKHTLCPTAHYPGHCRFPRTYQRRFLQFMFVGRALLRLLKRLF